MRFPRTVIFALFAVFIGFRANSLSMFTQLDSHNLGEQPLNFIIETNKIGSFVHFKVSVQSKDAALTSIPAAVLEVWDGAKQVASSALQNEQRDKCVVYEFDVSPKYLAKSRFTFSNMAESNGHPVPAGDFYWFYLKDFAGGDSRLSALPIRYHNPQYHLTFLLPAIWQKYSVLVEQWDGETYSPTTDKTIVVGHGPMITLRPPGWQSSAPSQDIMIVVFTRDQWDALHHGKFWPSLFAGGMMMELWHNQSFVFAMSSRYNWGELEGSKEVAQIIEQNRAANKMRNLYPE
jgi:hypothetical protein